MKRQRRVVIEWLQVKMTKNEWQRLVQRVTTNDNEWYNKWQEILQQMKTSDSEWQQGYKWQGLKTKESKVKRVILSLKMKQKANLVPEDLCNVWLLYISAI